MQTLTLCITRFTTRPIFNEYTCTLQDPPRGPGIQVIVTLAGPKPGPEEQRLLDRSGLRVIHWDDAGLNRFQEQHARIIELADTEVHPVTGAPTDWIGLLDDDAYFGTPRTSMERLLALGERREAGCVGPTSNYFKWVKFKCKGEDMPDDVPMTGVWVPGGCQIFKRALCNGAPAMLRKLAWRCDFPMGFLVNSHGGGTWATECYLYRHQFSHCSAIGSGASVEAKIADREKYLGLLAHDEATIIELFPQHADAVRTSLATTRKETLKELERLRSGFTRWWH
jgi:hypothetical protein